MQTDAHYLYSLSLGWLPPECPYWRLESEVRLALARNLGGQIPLRSEVAQAYGAFISDAGIGAGAKAPVQSLYEPWTLDPEVKVAFARSRGLRRGDAALHMDHVLASLRIALPGDLQLDSDHLAVILNAAGEIAERFPEQLAPFAADHLGWLGEYERQADEAWGDDPRAAFYRALLQETIQAAKPLVAAAARRSPQGT